MSALKTIYTQEEIGFIEACAIKSMGVLLQKESSSTPPKDIADRSFNMGEAMLYESKKRYGAMPSLK